MLSFSRSRPNPILLTVFATFIIGYLASDPASSNQAYLTNVNFVGGDIGVVWDAAAPNRCEAECNKNDQCKAWTWVQPGALPQINRPGLAGFCALKGSGSSKIADACCVSAVKTQTVPGFSDVVSVNKAVDVDLAKLAALAGHSACDTYAQSGVAQQQRNLAMGCGFQGGPWNAKYDDHYNWCMHGENQALAGGEQTRRQAALDKCAAEHGKPNSVTPIPIPRPLIQGQVSRAVTPLPIPRPLIQGQVSRAVTPLPIPGPQNQNQEGRAVLPLPVPRTAIDPGIGGQVPGIIIIENTVQRAVTPPSRSALINALMANAATRAQLQALPNIGRNPQNLTHQTLGGNLVSGNVSVAGSAAQNTNAFWNMAPSSGPTLPKGVDWAAGIQFSPFTAPPTYYLGGQSKPLGSVYVEGALVSNDTVGPMNQRKVVILGDDANAKLLVDLPNEAASYIVTFSLASDQPPEPYWYTGEQAPIKARVVFPGGYKDLTLIPTSGGFAAMAHIPVNPSSAAAEVQMTLFMLSINGGSGFVFGGITLTRL